MVRARRARKPRPRFATKNRLTTRISTPLTKGQWVSGDKSIGAERDRLLAEQGGLCAILLEPIISPCLDHDHYTGRVRGVVSSVVNTWEGQVQKLWGKHVASITDVSLSEALRRLADYMEQDHTHAKLHGKTVAELKLALKKMTSETIIRRGRELLDIDIDPSADKAEQIRVYVMEFIRQLEEDYLYER